MISGSIISTLMGEIIFLFTFPVLMFAILRFRLRVSFVSAISGFMAYLFFVIELESLIHSFLMQTSFGMLLSDHLFLSVLYYAVMAIVFEEGGRFLMFKYVLKHNDGRAESLSYGVIYGGADAILASGLNAFLQFSYASVYNELGREDFMATFEGIDRAEAAAIADSLESMTVTMALADIFERMIFIGICMGLSVIAFYAVKKHNYKYLAVSAVLRAITVIPGVLDASGVFNGRYTDIWLEAPIVLIVAYIASKLYADYDYEDDPFANLEKIKRTVLKK